MIGKGGASGDVGENDQGNGRQTERQSLTDSFHVDVRNCVVNGLDDNPPQVVVNGFHIATHCASPSPPPSGRDFDEADDHPSLIDFLPIGFPHHHPVAAPEEALPEEPSVPQAAESLLMLLQRYPVIWQGITALKSDHAAVQMHFVWGNPHIAREALPCNGDGSTAPLRISQRMQLENAQVEGVVRKMQIEEEHCMLLALPCGRDHLDVLNQSDNLQNGFITYLNRKQAAGIMNVTVPGTEEPAYVVHIFPNCEFANTNLRRIAPDLLRRVSDIAHLLIVITTP